MLNLIHTCFLAGFYFLQLLLFLMLVVGLGWYGVNFLFRPRQRDNLLPLIHSFALGAGFLALITLLAGFLGLLYKWLFIFLFLLSLPGGYSLSRELKPLKIRRPVSNSLLLSLTLLVVIIISVILILGALTPETGQDALWYHLTVARAYGLEHKIFAMPYNLPSNYPLNTEMLYTVVLLFSDEPLCKLIYLCFFFFLALALYYYGQEILSQEAGLIAVALAFTLWAALFLVSPVSAHSDVAVAFFQLLGLIQFYQFLRTHETKALILSGFYTGFAVGTKYTAIGFLWLPLLVILLIYLLKTSRTVAGLRKILLFVVVPASLFLPWAIKNYIFTNNPFFPFLPGWFKSPEGFTALLDSFYHRHGFVVGSSAPLETLIEQFKLKMKIALGCGNHLILPFLALMLFGLFFRHPYIRICSIYQWLCFLWFLNIVGHNEMVRYFSTTFPPLLLSLGYLVWQGLKRMSGPKVTLITLLLFLVIVYSFLSTQIKWLSYKTTAWDFRPALTRSARIDYLRTRPCGGNLYPVFLWINGNLSPEARVLFVHFTYPFYCQRRYMASGDFAPEIIETYFKDCGDAQSLYELMKEKGISHLFIAHPAPEGQVFEEFMTQHLRAVFSNEGATVYEIVP